MSTLLFFAEDDPLMSRMYERAFKANGFDLKIAFDGESAISLLHSMDPKPLVAVLDIMMPKKSGFEVLREMKADGALKSIPVVLLTNLAGEQDAEKGLELGAVLYLIKSQYSPIEIVSKIREIADSYSRGEGIPKVAVPVKDIAKKK
ncbi:MAG: response regulator [Patescibacteria group bacterium]|nr:response regulator [Patescibacteria group bacterium]MDE1946096.1 response regulator [Patescibacteria group bacterium]